MDKKLHNDTLGIRSHEIRSEFAEHSLGIFATSSFCFDSAEHAAAVFAEQEKAYVYSRFTNPTVEAFEKRLALMEGGSDCVATASGMAAILALGITLLKPGDEVVASRSLFGSTLGLFNNYIAKFGITFHYVDPCNLDEWRQHINVKTRFCFVESPTNPLCEVVDIQALAELSHAHDALLVVDNCFLTPILQKPIEMGADIVIHSATKYLDGQGRCMGGAIVGNEEIVGGEIFRFLRTCGPSMSPFNAWVFAKGLETLGIRMRAHCASAQKIAEFLQSQESVAKVFYPGLPTHPQHELATRQQSGFGGIVSFELKGGRNAVFKLINNCNLLSITANLGDTRSTVTHPASTTHFRIGEEARARAGISDSLVRVSVGLEDADDLIADISAALK